MDKNLLIDTILEKAFSKDGISRWCSGINVVKQPRSKGNLMLNEAISRGAILRLHIRQSDEADVELTKRKLLKIIKKNNEKEIDVVENMKVEKADELVQIAVFGSVRFKRREG